MAAQDRNTFPHRSYRNLIFHPPQFGLHCSFREQNHRLNTAGDRALRPESVHRLDDRQLSGKLRSDCDGINTQADMLSAFSLIIQFRCF